MAFETWDNPMGTDGFEFIEYAAPDPVAMGKLFEQLGFTAIARHRHKNVTLYRQGDDQLHHQRRAGFVRPALRAPARTRPSARSPSACEDAAAAYKRALELGAWGFDTTAGPMELNIPAIKGIGDSLIYLVDRWRGKGGAQPARSATSASTTSTSTAHTGRPPGGRNPGGDGLAYIDHLTHNVHRGRMKEWAEFYERLFNFREIRYFDIEGQLTGVKSKAMTSPCGKIRIPINEEGNEKQGADPGVSGRVPRRRHPAHRLGIDDIYATVEIAAKQPASVFLDTPDTYYELVDKRLPGHGEDLARLRKNAHPDRRRADRGWRPAAADFHQDPDRPDLLRDHPAQGRRGVRRGQLQGLVRVDRTGPDAPWGGEGAIGAIGATGAIRQQAQRRASSTRDIATPRIKRMHRLQSPAIAAREEGGR